MSIHSQEPESPSADTAMGVTETRVFWNALRHIAGLLTGAVGLLFLIGMLFELMEPQTELPRWVCAALIITLGVFPLLCSAALLNKSVFQVRPRACPACASEQRSPAGFLVKRRIWWAWYFGGWLLGMLWGASREQQVCCGQCNTLYFTQTRGTRIAGALLWMVVLWIFLSIAIGLQSE